VYDEIKNKIVVIIKFFLLILNFSAISFELSLNKIM